LKSALANSSQNPISKEKSITEKMLMEWLKAQALGSNKHKKKENVFHLFTESTYVVLKQMIIQLNRQWKDMEVK
jgi:hypothetical protein